MRVVMSECGCSNHRELYEGTGFYLEQIPHWFDYL